MTLFLYSYGRYGDVNNIFRSVSVKGNEDLNMKIKDVQQCSFQNWYNIFKKDTVESIILPLPDGFSQYILKDGIVLPLNTKPYTVEPNSDDSDSDVDWETANTQEALAPHFPDFDAKIKDAIDVLGGKVFPKLNWSSPKDAVWIAFNNSCCCTTVSDIYLLLQSSDFIIHDLTKAFQKCEDYVKDENIDNQLCLPADAFYLVLRKWIEIDTSGEFRCFVRDNELIAICQREDSLYFDHIGAEKGCIIQDITSFFKRNIQPKFNSSDYVFDVFRKKKKKVCLLDFNPFGKVTDPLLFNWEELTDGSLLAPNTKLPVFRYVDENYGVQPRSLSYYAVPKDVVDISTGEDSFKFADFLKLKIDSEKQECSTDEEKDEN